MLFHLCLLTEATKIQVSRIALCAEDEEKVQVYRHYLVICQDSS